MKIGDRTQTPKPPPPRKDPPPPPPRKDPAPPPPPQETGKPASTVGRNIDVKA